MMLRVLDLFSGIGGFSLGLERTGGFETVAFCEYEKFPRSILKKHWPDVPCFPDVRTLKGSDIDGPVDVICGGYPCQPFSTAGQRRGKEDDRHLWPEFSRLVDELRPTWIIGENVAGHISMGLDDVLSDLEGQGYAARTFVIPACAVAAPHRRDRVWTVAHAPQLQRDGGGKHRKSSERQISKSGKRGGPQSLAHAISIGQPGQGEQIIPGNQKTDRKGEASHAFNERFRCEWLPEPDVGRVANGVPRRVDRLKALGNAVVPQIPQMIGNAILEAEKETA
jgi:DNA (cytosine-5)-methyltransferase 1